MTTMKLRLVPRAALIARTSPRLTSSITEGTGIDVAFSGGIYTVRLDFASLSALASIAAGDRDNTFLAVYNSDTLTYGRVGVDVLTTALSGTFVPQSRQVISGAGLTGGGDLSSDRTLAVGAGTGITVNADDVALTVPVAANLGGTGVANNAASTITISGSFGTTFTVTGTTSITFPTTGTLLANSRQVISGGGLTGGGDLSADRTLAVGAGTGIAVNADDVALNISGLSADATPDSAADYVATFDASASTHKKVLLSNLPNAGGAATNEAYVTIGNTAGLSAERALAVTAPITLTDGGANSTATIAVMAASTSASGVSELATTAEMATGTDSARVPSVQAVRDGTGAGWASFSVHKNGTDQTGVADITYTQITFGTEIYDVGSFFASSAWTPPAGKVSMMAASFMNGTITLGNFVIIAIYKNGSLFKQGLSNASGSGGSGAIAIDDTANGTDVYTVYGYIDLASGTGLFSGNTANTYFMGRMIN